MPGNVTKSSYIPSLDGIRAISIIIVLFSHAGVSKLIPGGFGVTIFFFLSGFIITTLMFREHDKNGTISLRNFYIRRALRLTPSLLLCIAAAIILVLLGAAHGTIDPLTLTSQLFFFFNYFSIYGNAHPIDGLSVLWSLSVEEHFYLIWPTVFILFMKNRVHIVQIAGLAVLLLIWRYIRLFFLHDTEWTIYTLTDTRFDSLIFGCLLAILQNKYKIKQQNNYILVYSIIFSSILFLIFSLLFQEDSFRSTWRYTIQGIALLPLFHFSVTMPNLIIFRPLNWTISRMIGVWSYNIYLIHYVIILAFESHNLAPSHKIIFALIVLFLSSIWAALIFHFVEKPLQKIRRRF
ncbi:acyltransferase family protein [Gluconacetobacter sp. Hr-1-5]|uniref:acyltransferase family protein n=1 Tax=Gluconacetobacter sp. Hr-1-5 TaxID=3395370 RepID=UPI003B52C382